MARKREGSSSSSGSSGTRNCGGSTTTAATLSRKVKVFLCSSCRLVSGSCLVHFCPPPSPHHRRHYPVTLIVQEM